MLVNWEDYFYGPDGNYANISNFWIKNKVGGKWIPLDKIGSTDHRYLLGLIISKNKDNKVSIKKNGSTICLETSITWPQN